MSNVFHPTGDQLTNALRALGVNFIMGGQDNNDALSKHPARLIAALSQSSEARLRLALVPLFLEHSEFAAHVRAVAQKLDPAARLTLQCYYTAAVILGRQYQPQKKSLPDYFSKYINLSLADNPAENLRALAKRHRELSGARVNWLGTYQHAAQVWLKGLEYQKV